MTIAFGNPNLNPNSVPSEPAGQGAYYGCLQVGIVFNGDGGGVPEIAAGGPNVFVTNRIVSLPLISSSNVYMVTGLSLAPSDIGVGFSMIGTVGVPGSPIFRYGTYEIIGIWNPDSACQATGPGIFWNQTTPPDDAGTGEYQSKVFTPSCETSNQGQFSAVFEFPMLPFGAWTSRD